MIDLKIPFLPRTRTCGGAETAAIRTNLFPNRKTATEAQSGARPPEREPRHLPGACAWGPCGGPERRLCGLCGLWSPADAAATCSPAADSNSAATRRRRSSLFSGSTPGLCAAIKQREREGSKGGGGGGGGATVLPVSFVAIGPLSHPARPAAPVIRRGSSAAGPASATFNVITTIIGTELTGTIFNPPVAPRNQ